MGRLDHCYNIADLREVARRRLPKGVFEYLDKGTEDMVALGNNRRAFEDGHDHFRQARGSPYGDCAHRHCRPLLV